MNLHGVSTITPMAQLPSSSSTSSTNSASSTGSANSLANQAANQAESTFISLLVTELQSQDPTQPMDPTDMVSQMFSMNQLEQLININQTLSAAFPMTTASSSSANGGAPSTASIATGAN